MSSIVELIISAVGADQASAALQRVKAALQENAGAIRASGLASAATAIAEGELAKIVAEQTAARRQQIVAEADARVERAKAAKATKDQAEAEKELAAAQAKSQAQHSAATSSLLQMAVALVAIRGAYRGLTDALGEGAHFEQLSLRTGENIRNLVMMEQAGKNAGLSEGMLARSAVLLDKVLGGLDATGGKANLTLHRLGTSVEELKPLSLSEQLEVLSAGFAKIDNQSDRAAIALKLFGRSGAEMLQLFGDPHALSLAREQTDTLGKAIERNAQASVHLAQSWNGVTANIREMGQAAATQLMPELQGLVDLLGKLHPGALGAALGIGGAGALGGGAFFLGISQIDQSLAAKLPKMQEGVTKSIVAGASGAMSNIAAWTPIALATLVTAQVVTGIINAWADARVQEVFAHMDNVKGHVDPFRRSDESALTAQQQQANLAAAQHELEVMETRQAALRAERASLVGKTETILGGGGVTGFRSVQMSGAKTEELATLDEAIPKLSAEIKNMLANTAHETGQLAQNVARLFNESMASLIATAPQAQQKLDKLKFEDMTPAQKLADIARQRSGIEQERAAIPAGASDDAKAAKNLELDTKLLELTHEQAAAQKALDTAQKLADERALAAAIDLLKLKEAQAHFDGDEAGAKAAQREMEAMRASVGLTADELKVRHQIDDLQQETDARAENAAAEKRRDEDAIRGIEQTKGALEVQVAAIRENLAELEADTGRTAVQQWQDRKIALMKEAAEIRLEIARLTSEKEEAIEQGRPEVGQKAASAAAQGQNQLDANGRAQKQLGADPSSLSAQMGAEINSLQKQLGTVQQGIAHSFGSVITAAMGATSAGLQRLIGDTQYWSQKLGNIAGPIMGAITKSIAEMFTTWIVQRGLAAAKNMLFSAQEGAADTAAKTPGALMASISSFGAADAIGAAALLAAMAVLPGLETGGPAYAGQAYVVGEKRPELFVPKSDGFVFPDASRFNFSAPAIPSSGAINRAALQSAARSAPSPAASSSGASGGFAAAQPPPQVAVFLDYSAYRRYLEAHVTATAHEVYDKRARSGS